MTRHIQRLLSVCLLVVLAACGGEVIQGVVSVEVLGGDRTLALGSSTVLTAHVVAGSGVDTGVTWESTNGSVAQVDASGFVTVLAVGSTTIRATSTADTTRSDAVVITVTTPTVAQDGAFVASVIMPLSAPMAVAASTVFFDEEPIEITSAAVTQIDANLWAGPITPVGADDAVIITLPSPADLPDVLLTDAESFLRPVNLMTECELEATVPTAKVTRADMGEIAMPGVLLYTVEGAVLTMVANQPLDLFGPAPVPFATLEFMTWVYADTATSIHTTGDDCSVGSTPISVAIDLVAGWNQLSWTFILDEETEAVTGLALGNSDTTDLHIMGVAGLGDAS